MKNIMYVFNFLANKQLFEKVTAVNDTIGAILIFLNRENNSQLTLPYEE